MVELNYSENIMQSLKSNLVSSVEDLIVNTSILVSACLKPGVMPLCK
jgi:hypothetical protein